MEAWLLREWQRRSFWQVLLRPLSWLFAAIIAIRRSMFKSGIFHSTLIGVPVIVVGNITVGGTGKTPLVVMLAALLKKAGYRCGVITRGYRRGYASSTASGATRVDSSTANSQSMGDEAVLLSRRLSAPVYVSADRVLAAKTLLKSHPDVNIIISDDGLQHYQLHRDVELCVVDATRNFGNGALLPAGPLREPLGRLATVSAVILNQSSVQAESSMIVSDSTGAPIFAMNFGNESLHQVTDKLHFTPFEAQAKFKGMKIAAVAGIGNPQRFFDHLTRLGFQIETFYPFPDHHPFSADELAAISADIVLMTEKDAVKCESFGDSRLWYLRIDAILPTEFEAFLLEKLSALRK